MAKHKTGQLLTTWAGVTVELAMLMVLASTLASAQNQPGKVTSQAFQHLKIVAKSTIKTTSAVQAASSVSSQEEIALVRRTNLPIPSKEAARLSRLSAALPLPEPTAESSIVVGSQAGGFIGFNGLDNIDQRSANNGNQFSVEPPDQGLCVSDDYVMEPVNSVIRVFDKSGNPLTGVEDVNSFFGLAPAVIRGNPRITGPSLSDPRCFYDTHSKRWFVSILEGDSGNNAGATGRNYNLLAVSKTSDPTGEFTIFQYDVTDDGLNGTPNHAGCPCFGDQPLLGVDKYGVYQSTNEFGAATFNGAQIYAISKAKLVAAADSSSPQLPVVVQIDASQALVPYGGLSYSIQPATSPSPTHYEEKLDGVEYFLSALQFGNPGYEVYDNRIAVWALTNTESLSRKKPALTLSFNVIPSETYGQPDPAAQKPGEIPLGASLGEPLELINTNDDRMNQVIYSNGLLYSGVNSKLLVGGASQTGAAWFAVKPKFDGPTLKGKVVHQGYLAVTGENVIFPSVGVGEDGEGAIVFTLVGPDYFPSVAYSRLDDDGDVSRLVHIAGAGQDPDDGFTGYPEYTGGNVGRWGDYSAATWDGERVWFASEYIPSACATNALPCREPLFNWGSFVGSILP